jgi:LacI family transcriptional regulator
LRNTAMTNKKSTIHDIAKALNVTASTVSRALNDNPRISEDMRKAVQATATSLGYQPNHIAAALRMGKTKIIGVVIPTANRSFFSNVLRGIEGVAKAADYNVIICQSNDDPAEEIQIIDTLLRLRVDGIIASIARETRSFEHYKKALAQKVPLVLFDRVNETLGANNVVLDDHLGAYLATEHLIQQGYRRIAHLAGPQHINIYKYRLRGYQDALEAAGLPFDPQLVTYGNLGVEDGQQYLAQLLRLSTPPDAVFSASDYAATGVLQLAKERQIKVPEQLGIIGFANEMFTQLVEPSLSSIDQHSERMGEFAARIFLEEVDGNDRIFIPRKTVLSPSLVIRNSSIRQKKS